MMKFLQKWGTMLSCWLFAAAFILTGVAVGTISLYSRAAEESEWQEITDWGTAMANGSQVINGKFKLMGDIVFGRSINIGLGRYEAGNVTIDLNGFNLTLGIVSIGNDSKLRIIDSSTTQTGKLNCDKITRSTYGYDEEPEPDMEIQLDINVPFTGNLFFSSSHEPEEGEQGDSWDLCGPLEEWITVNIADDLEIVRDEDGYIVALNRSVTHTHEYTWEQTTAPTCTTAGEETGTCSCGDEITRPVAALNHDYVAAEPTAPTCTNAGYTRHTCSRCGDHYDDTIVPALEHDYDDGVVTTKPTCVGTGIKEYTCQRTGCGHKKYETIAADNSSHDLLDDWAVITNPDCLTPGMEKRVCHNECEYYETRSIPALGHDYVATVHNPTCVETGYTAHQCSRCDANYNDTVTEATGIHVYGEWVEVVAPTETSFGTTERSCTMCNHKETGSLPKLTPPAKNEFPVIPVVAGTAAGVVALAALGITIGTIVSKRKN